MSKMKEFFSKTYVHYAIVLGIVALSCGLLVGLTNYITAPIIEENLTKVENQAYSEALPVAWKNYSIDERIDSAYLLGFVSGGKVVKNGQNVVGYVFKAGSTNAYGEITLIIAVDTNGVIKGVAEVSFSQTVNQTNSHQYISELVNKNVKNGAPNSSLTSGATYTKNLIASLINGVNDSLAEVLK